MNWVFMKLFSFIFSLFFWVLFSKFCTSNPREKFLGRGRSFGVGIDVHCRCINFETTIRII